MILGIISVCLITGFIQWVLLQLPINHSTPVHCCVFTYMSASKFYELFKNFLLLLLLSLSVLLLSETISHMNWTWLRVLGNESSHGRKGSPYPHIHLLLLHGILPGGKRCSLNFHVQAICINTSGAHSTNIWERTLATGKSEMQSSC